MRIDHIRTDQKLRLHLMWHEDFRTFLSFLFIVPFLSALGLLFLPLKDDQRDILGFVALISSIVASVPTYFFLFFLYCNTIHSTCS